MMLANGVEQGERWGVRFDEGYDAAGRRVPVSSHQAGLAASDMKVIENQRQNGRLGGVVLVHPKWSPTKSLPQFGFKGILPACRRVQPRRGPHLDRQLITQTLERDGAVVSLASSFGRLAANPRRVMKQKHTGAGLVAMLPTGTAAALGANVTLGKQSCRFQQCRMRTIDHHHGHPLGGLGQLG